MCFAPDENRDVGEIHASPPDQPQCSPFPTISFRK